MKKIDRRRFLNNVFRSSLNMFVAVNFGCVIKEATRSDINTSTAIVYGTRYGATYDTVKWISAGMDANVKLLNIEDLNFEIAVSSYEQFILGSGVWVGGVHSRLKQFVTEQSKHLQNKVIASFVVCGSQNNSEPGRKQIKKYLAQINQPLHYEPKFVSQFGGRIDVERLSDVDRTSLERFYKKYLKKELKNWDRTDQTLANNFGKKLRSSMIVTKS